MNFGTAIVERAKFFCAVQKKSCQCGYLVASCVELVYGRGRCCILAQFGGGPGNYQLLEDEDAGGQARLTLLVDPSIGPVDAELVRTAFLTNISAGSGVERVMGLVWGSDGLLQVKRGAPRAGLTGKIQHLHQARRPAGVAE